MKEKIKELHDSAWKLLESKGLKLGERMKVRSSFAAINKEEYPFIESKMHKDVMCYNSSYDMISNMLFKTEEEAVLANAIYLNMNEIHGIDEFISVYKFTCRIIGMNTEWSTL